MNVLKSLLILCTGLLVSSSMTAQNEEPDFSQSTINMIIDPDIRSVVISPNNPYPVVDLKTGRLNLSFDHMGYDVQDYVYTLVHCNSDWQPSDLQDNEYIKGYTEDRIRDMVSSNATIAPYTRYQMTLPNQNMSWAVSGNFLLKIFDDRDNHRLVMIRRFMVVDNQWGVSARMAQVIDAKKIFTHQEIDFSVKHENFLIASPQLEVKAYVVQNMRWDRVKGPFAPRPISIGASLLNFDYQDSIVFPAGKDFRYFDMRSFEYRGNNVLRIGREDDYFTVELKPEYDRFETHSYSLNNDINGGYVIENRTPGQNFLQTDYAKVYFNLHRNEPFEDADVYAIGEMTDWLLKEEFRMEYDPDTHAYYCGPMLKQGFYNYLLAIVDRNTKTISTLEDVEGNWHETRNQYSIFVYYRPRGSRYDRLMSVGGIDSIVRK